MILHKDYPPDNEPDQGPETVITDFTPIEGEPRKPLYPRQPVVERNDRGPSKGLLVAVLLVAICAVLVMVAVPVRG